MTAEIHLVALSGGKDSSAMALRLREEHPDIAFRYICTPTGNELPSMIAHWTRLESLLGSQIEHVKAPMDLVQISRRQKMLPNTRMRWCTRLTKIVPYLAFVARLRTQTPGVRVISYVGLRADEPAEDRGGMFGDGIDEYRFPLREWGWSLGDVADYLGRRGVVIPPRTDCAICPFQRLGEWHALWRDYPDAFEQGVALEREISAAVGRAVTIRSPSRDTWPADLAGLRARFEAGAIPPTRGVGDKHAKCRICSL